jgi:hypothetical protein
MKIKIIFVSVLIILCLLVVFQSQTASQNMGHVYLVKLYAGEKVIGSWQSKEIGRIEGESLTFVVKGDFDLEARQVRIHGVYTVEQTQ